VIGFIASVHGHANHDCSYKDLHPTTGIFSALPTLIFLDTATLACLYLGRIIH
jgi:hypothetical protein